jgi:hypothetical protein
MTITKKILLDKILKLEKIVQIQEKKLQSHEFFQQRLLNSIGKSI